jgi:hypothetical protein
VGVATMARRLSGDTYLIEIGGRRTGRGGALRRSRARWMRAQATGAACTTRMLNHLSPGGPGERNACGARRARAGHGALGALGVREITHRGAVDQLEEEPDEKCPEC